MQEKMIIRRAHERGHADHGWLKTWHTFSFADYYDEEWMGFKSLRVMNEDFIAPGKGFDLHGHRDMEILTYVMKGALRHVDTMGNNEVIRPGEFQRMTAGTGVHHMEVSATQDEETHLYQIWILPKERGLAPSYEQKSITDLPSYVIPGAPSPHVIPGERERDPGPRKTLVASPDGRDGSLTIHQDCEVWLWRLEAGETATIEVPEGKAGWVQIVEGKTEIETGNSILISGDACVINAATKLKPNRHTEFLLFLI